MLQTVDDMSAWWNYDAQVFFGQPEPGAELEREAKKVAGVTEVETRLNASASLKRADGSENQGILAIGLPPDSQVREPDHLGGALASSRVTTTESSSTPTCSRTSPTSAWATACASRSAARRTTGTIVGIATGTDAWPDHLLRPNSA